LKATAADNDDNDGNDNDDDDAGRIGDDVMSASRNVASLWKPAVQSTVGARPSQLVARTQPDTAA